MRDRNPQINPRAYRPRGEVVSSRPETRGGCAEFDLTEWEVKVGAALGDQLLFNAVDVSRFDDVSLVLTATFQGASSITVQILTGSSLDTTSGWYWAASFGSLDYNSSGVASLLLPAATVPLSRFIRWSVFSATNYVRFMIRGVGRVKAG